MWWVIPLSVLCKQNKEGKLYLACVLPCYSEGTPQTFTDENVYLHTRYSGKVREMPTSKRPLLSLQFL